MKSIVITNLVMQTSGWSSCSTVIKEHHLPSMILHWLTKIACCKGENGEVLMMAISAMEKGSHAQVNAPLVSALCLRTFSNKESYGEGISSRESSLGEGSSSLELWSSTLCFLYNTGKGDVRQGPS